MAKKDSFRPRSGYARVPGRGRRYKVLSTGEEISRREYIKRTEAVQSLEKKAKTRKKAGYRNPMKRYDAIVEQFKKQNPNVKVRGNTKEAKEFRKWYAEFVKPEIQPQWVKAVKKGKMTLREFNEKKRQARMHHLRYAVKLGYISQEQYERIRDTGDSK